MYVKACHKKTGECIAGRIEIARTFSERLIGLMGRRTMIDAEGLYFPGCKSIHTFFLKFAIDVLFLDKEMKVTKMVSRMKPYRLAFAPLQTRDALELSCGVLEKHGLNVGDAITLIELNNGDHDPSNKFTLKVIKSPSGTQAFVFAKKTVYIGSTYAQNDLIMNAKGIAAQHARIWREKKNFYIQNLSDTRMVISNKISLNKNETTELTTGTEIDMGEVGLRFINSVACSSALNETSNRKPTGGASIGDNSSFTNCIKLCKFKKIAGLGGIALCVFFVLIMAINAVKENKGNNSSDKAYPAASSEEPIALPAKGKYGYIKNNDKSHPDKVIFTFKTDASNVELCYTAGGIDSDKEVSIHLNGQPIGYAPLAKWAWGEETVLRLPREFLIKGGENHLVFDNMGNPPHFNQWAVKNIWIKALAENLCDVDKARKQFELGEEMHEQKTISKGNLYVAYRYYCDAVSYLQDCNKDIEVLRQAELRKERTMQELDALHNNLMFAFKKAYEMKDYRKCRSILQNMVLHFPDKSDERHKQAAEKLEEYNRYYEMRHK